MLLPTDRRGNRRWENGAHSTWRVLLLEFHLKQRLSWDAVRILPRGRVGLCVHVVFDFVRRMELCDLGGGNDG